MKKMYLVFFLCFLIGKIQAQSCATTDLTESQMQALPYYGNNAFLQHYADSLVNVFNNPVNRIESQPDVYYRIPIQFWIYTWEGRNSLLNTDELDRNKRLKALMWYLNDAMQRNQVPIRFYMLCPRFVEKRSETIGEIDVITMTEIGLTYFTPKTLNCHIVNDIKDAGGFYNPVANAIYIQGNGTELNINGYSETSVLFKNSTFIHEVGHWLGLQHTHANDGIPCRKEPVSREVFSSICGAGIPLRHCELRGDALCDTPADPDISNHGSDLLSNCAWVTNIKDDRGDFYAPDTKNYMAYTRPDCRTRFTTMQKQVMLWSVNNQQVRMNTSFMVTPANAFDIYEPDNNPQASSLLRFNEPQIHSFSEMGSCEDDDDWVKFIYPFENRALEDMTLEIESVDGYNFPVSEVEFWDSGSGGGIGFNEIASIPMLTNRLFYTQSIIQPTKIVYTIPCSLPAGRNYVFRVVRNGNQTGRYKLTLKKKTPQLFGDRALCLGIPKTYILDNVPSGVTINWQVSRNIQIMSGQGTNTLTVVANTFGEGSIGATITGCNNTFVVPTIPIIMGITHIFPINFTATPYVGQTVTFTIQKPEPLNRDAYTYQLFVIPQSTNQFYNWSLVSYVDTGTHIEMYVKVGLGVAEIAMEVNSCNQIVARPNIYVEGIPDPNCYYGFRVSPNPTKDFISISRNAPEPCIGLRTYQGKLYNKYSKLIWQGEIKEDIQIDARKLPNDVYFLHLTDEKGNTQKQQIILNK